VFGPSSPNLLVRRKLASSRRLLRNGDRGSLIVGESDRRCLVGACKLKDNPGYIVLGVRWEVAGDLDGLIQ